MGLYSDSPVNPEVCLPMAVSGKKLTGRILIWRVGVVSVSYECTVNKCVFTGVRKQVEMDRFLTELRRSIVKAGSDMTEEQRMYGRILYVCILVCVCVCSGGCFPAAGQ